MVDGEFVEAPVQVSDGKLRLLTGGEAPITNLGVFDHEGANSFFLGRRLTVDFFSVKVVDAGARCDVIGRDEVEPLLAFGVVPNDGGVENVMELSFSESDRKEEAAVFKDLPMRLAKAVVVGEEESVVLTVKAIDFCPGGTGDRLMLSGDEDADAGAVW